MQVYDHGNAEESSKPSPDRVLGKSARCNMKRACANSRRQQRTALRNFPIPAFVNGLCYSVSLRPQSAPAVTHQQQYHDNRLTQKPAAAQQASMRHDSQSHPTLLTQQLLMLPWLRPILLVIAMWAGPESPVITVQLQ